MTPDWGVHDVVRRMRPKGWAERVVDRLKTAEDDFNVQQVKLLVFVAFLFLVVCGPTWGFIFIYLETYPACCFPFLMGGLSAAALSYMLFQRTVLVARHILCLGLCLCALGVHLTFLGFSGEVSNWALLAPQICLLTGGNVLRSTLMLVGVVATMVAMVLVRCFTDTSTYRIQPELNADWTTFFTIVNAVIPWSISFLLNRIMLRRQCQHDELQRSMAAAEEVAQLIINFELDAIAQLPLADHSSILGLLQRVAYNLRLYRPYIPAHLLPSPSVQQERASTHFDAAATAGFDTLMQEPSVYDALPMLGMPPNESHSTGRPSVPPRPRSPGEAGRGLWPPSRSFEVPHDIRSGTLLYVSLHLMDAYASHSRHNDKVERIRSTADLFCELVMTAVKETHGVVHFLQQNSCFISWNFGSPCRMHAVNACHAALTIRDRLCTAAQKEGMAPMALSSGVWSGLLVSGTFGTQDYKSSGVLGYGVSRVMELQQYSAAHQRPIMTNAKARVLAEAQPEQHFLPVDVLSVDPIAHPRDGSSAMDRSDVELVYELLWERPQRDGEWMYQLQRLEEEGHNEIEKDIEKLLCQAQAGVQDICSYQTQIARLLLSEDPTVSRMGTQLENLVLTKALDRPYRLEHIRGWQLYTPPPAPTGVPLVPLKRNASSSSVASSCSVQSTDSSSGNAFSLRRSSGVTRQRSRLEFVAPSVRLSTPHSGTLPIRTNLARLGGPPFEALTSPSLRASLQL